MGKLLAIFRAFILVLTIGIWPLVYSIGTIFRKHTPERAFALRKHWLKWIGLPIMGLKIEGSIKQEGEACIYASNHRAISDPFVICTWVDAFVIAKAEVGKYPILNKGFEVTGVVYVDREEKDSRKAVREKMMETIRSGHNVLIFPEGTVGLQAHTLPFKVGAFYTAAENGVKVVPIALEYKSEQSLWKYSNIFQQFFYEFSKFTKEVKIKRGEAFHHPDGEVIRKYCEDWINENLAEMQHNWTDIKFELA